MKVNKLQWFRVLTWMPIFGFIGEILFKKSTGKPYILDTNNKSRIFAYCFIELSALAIIIDVIYKAVKA